LRNDPELTRGSVEATGTDCPEETDFRRILLLEGEPPTVHVTEDHILSILCVRRGREAAMGRELFSDPAWDILLELYAALLGGRKMTLGDVARSIDVPRSTIARWVSVLSDRQLILASVDVEDAAQLWLQLSPKGNAAMKNLVDQWGSAFRAI